MSLTGRFDLRKTFTGKIVLRVEEEVKPFWARSAAARTRWRDATLMDLTAPEMRTLMDARFKPSLVAHLLKAAEPPPEALARTKSGHASAVGSLRP